LRSLRLRGENAFILLRFFTAEIQGVEKKRKQKWPLKNSKAKNLYREDAKKNQTSWAFDFLAWLFCLGGIQWRLITSIADTSGSERKL